MTSAVPAPASQASTELSGPHEHPMRQTLLNFANMLHPFGALVACCFLAIAPWLLVCAFRGRLQVTMTQLLLWPVIVGACIVSLINEVPEILIIPGCLAAGFVVAWFGKSK